MKIRDWLGIARIKEDGSALPLTLLVLLVLTVLGMSMIAVATTNFSIATTWKSYSDAFYAAEAGLESGMVDLRALLATQPTPTAAQLAGLRSPALATSHATFVQYAVAAVTPVPYQTQFKTGAYVGLFGSVTDYAIAAQTAGTDGSTANLAQGFKYVRVPLFQFGIFYGKGVDLEIAPGAPMTIHGRVHANSDIYVGPGSSLQFDSVITAAGTINRRIKRDSAIPYGLDPQIKDASGSYQTLNFDHSYRQGFSGTWSSTQQWVDAAKSRFGNNLQDQAMGVGQIVPPGDPALFDPSTPHPDVLAHQLVEIATASDSSALQNAKLYNQAGLRIVDGMATDQQGNSVPLPPGLISTKSFFDAREGRTMTVTEVDVSVLRSSGVAPSNGVLYVAQRATSGAGVRLVNGSQLPSQGLTVVSQNPIYVQGDYNTVNKVRAAVMADAITVLSNNWAPNSSDSKGDQTSDRRPAATTTVNAAFATGPSAESTLSNGNGQLENSIRFLEDWGSNSINYNGSLVALWHSQQATQPWRSPGTGAGQYYTAPHRNWSYDTLFNTSQPPGTPAGVIMMKGQWSRK